MTLNELENFQPSITSQTRYGSLPSGLQLPDSDQCLFRGVIEKYFSEDITQLAVTQQPAIPQLPDEPLRLDNIAMPGSSPLQAVRERHFEAYHSGQSRYRDST